MGQREAKEHTSFSIGTRELGFCHGARVWLHDMDPSAMACSQPKRTGQ